MLQVIEMNLLHENMSIVNKGGSGAQGSIYFVKYKNDKNGKIFVLKLFDGSCRTGYERELVCLQTLSEIKVINKQYFPKMFSYRENSLCAEIVMEAMGPNLR
jgi:hypothetical protein